MTLRNGSKITTVFSFPLTLSFPHGGEGTEEVISEPFLSMGATLTGTRLSITRENPVFSQLLAD